MHDIITTDFGSKIFWGFRTKRVSSMRANWLFQVNLFDIFFRCLKMRDSHNSYQKDGIFFSRKALEYCFFFGGVGITSLFFCINAIFFQLISRNPALPIAWISYHVMDCEWRCVRPLPIFRETVGNPESKWKVPKWVRGSIHPRNLTWKQIKV